MTTEQRDVWLSFWPRVGQRLAVPGEPTERGTIPDTRNMWSVYEEIGGYTNWLTGRIDPYSAALEMQNGPIFIHMPPGAKFLFTSVVN